jgi:hypothetical protein
MIDKQWVTRHKMFNGAAAQPSCQREDVQSCGSTDIMPRSGKSQMAVSGIAKSVLQ